jgi:hypothetical protein
MGATTMAATDMVGIAAAAAVGEYGPEDAPDCIAHAPGPASPTFSVSSWDSHANYQYSMDEEADGGGGGGEADAGDGGVGESGFANLGGTSPRTIMLCFCDMSTFKTPRTLLRVILVVSATTCNSMCMQ